MDQTPIDELTAHPDAEAFWARGDVDAAAEDQTAILEDIRAHGIREPLDVWEDDGRLWVVDGVSRLAAARALGLPTVPTRRVTIPGGGVPAWVLSKNAMRHRLTTGQRVLSYIAQRRDAILTAWQATGDKDGMDSRSLAAAAGVSQKDFLAGVELTAALTLQGIPGKAADGRVVILPAPSDEAQAGIKKTFDDVQRGRTPIRRWKTALAGYVNTAGKARPPTDHGGKLLSAARALLRVWITPDAWWGETSAESRQLVCDALCDAIAAAPEDVINAITRTLQQLEK